MKKTIIFPGQGAQVVGMGRELAEAIPECGELFERADALLGYSLSAICFDGPQEELNKSNHAQLGIFVTSAVCFKALTLKQPELQFDFAAGHSLGEWTALYAAGVVSFEDTLRVLKARGEFMQAACEVNPGAMLAVMGSDEGALTEAAAKAGAYVANFNSLGQTVLSGTAASIDAVEAILKEQGVKRAVRLPVAGGFHSPLMESAAEKMAEFLKNIELKDPAFPVLSNVTGLPHGTSDIAENMVKQITSSVRWVASTQWLASQGVEEMCECGPGKVLAGLIKRIDKSIRVFNISGLSDLN